MNGKVSVIIPAYQASGLILETLDSIANQTYTNWECIIVDDGSTDNTDQIVQQFSHVQYISYQKNAGKGWALRKAFAYAIEKNYVYGITIDSDGQHFAKDLVAFADKLEQDLTILEDEEYLEIFQALRSGIKNNEGQICTLNANALFTKDDGKAILLTMKSCHGDKQQKMFCGIADLAIRDDRFMQKIKLANKK